MTTRSNEAAAELLRDGGALDLGPDKTRLWNRIYRLLAQGGPISADRLELEIAEVGIEQAQADALVEAWTERDDAGAIVGMGITYTPTAHRMTIDGATRWVWCALDTLFVPVLLDTQVTIESAAPGTGETTRLHAGPGGVSRVEPAGAVITFPLRDGDQVDISSSSRRRGGGTSDALTVHTRLGVAVR